MSDLELTMMRRVGELKAEVERLKKFNDEALAHIAKEERKSRERLDMEQAENARLKAQVERLTKAGDSMAELMFIDKDYIGSPKQEAVVEWCKATEAKEGKTRA
jgi:uncharacterized small protein (DUF1192 family)